MALQDLSNGRILSFKYAFEGIATALKEEPNLKFHFIIAIVAIVAGFVFKISRPDFLLVIFLIGFVICVELTNTAIEAVVDAFTEKEHPRAKCAKDIAAASVLIAAITSAVLGFIVFLPYITNG